MIPPELRKIIDRVTRKRARTVIDHILAHGQITTEELQETYGYDHPPRAARDVREEGIPLETIKVVSSKTGRKIAAYKFGDISKIKKGRIGGRKAFSKKFKDVLLKRYDHRCTITNEKLEGRYLQIDHRIPYDVAGDEDSMNPDDYMLLDASAQRAKSFSCENCKNFKEAGLASVCADCFWASPEDYSHVALREVRQELIVWSGEEIVLYDLIKSTAKKNNMSVNQCIKRFLSTFSDMEK